MLFSPGSVDLTLMQAAVRVTISISSPFLILPLKTARNSNKDDPELELAFDDPEFRERLGAHSDANTTRHHHSSSQPMALEEMNSQPQSHSSRRSRSSKLEAGLGLGEDDAPFATRPPPDKLPSHKSLDASGERKHRSGSQSRRHTQNPSPNPNPNPNHTRTASAPNAGPLPTPGGELARTYPPPAALQPGRQEGLLPVPGLPVPGEGLSPNLGVPIPGELAGAHSPPAALQPGRRQEGAGREQSAGSRPSSGVAAAGAPPGLEIQ